MQKYRIYIDEVGNPDLDSSVDINHRYLCLTGAIFELGYAANVLSPRLETLKKNYFEYHPDEPIVLHRKEIINHKYPFQVLSDPVIEANFSKDFLTLIDSLEFTVISVLIDKLEHKIKYNLWRYDPYHYCMEILVERFHFFLKDVNAVGDVMIESRGGKEDIRLKKSFRRILDTGTHYIDSEKLRYNLTSLELKVKPKLLNIAGLQIADLLAFPARRYIFKKRDLLIDDRETFSDEIIKILEKKFYKRNNEIEGFGIKTLP